MSIKGPSTAMTSTATDLFVEAALLRGAGKVAVVYVEGDSDRRLYQGLFESQVAVLPSITFSNVEAVVRKYDSTSDKAHLPLILGVVDRDYRIAANEVNGTENLICTELRDIECEMIDSEAFDNLINELGSAKLSRLWPNARDFGRVVTNSAASVGKVRAYNHLKKLNIDFKSINFEKIHDLKTHQLLEEKLIQQLRGAQKAGVAIPNKFDEVNRVTSDKRYARHLGIALRLCRGHDIFELISFYFRKGFARQGVVADASALESALRIGFKPMLKSSPTVIKIIDWFTINKLQNVLR